MSLAESLNLKPGSLGRRSIYTVVSGSENKNNKDNKSASSFLKRRKESKKVDPSLEGRYTPEKQFLGRFSPERSQSLGRFTPERDKSEGNMSPARNSYQYSVRIGDSGMDPVEMKRSPRLRINPGKEQTSRSPVENNLRTKPKTRVDSGRGEGGRNSMQDRINLGPEQIQINSANPTNKTQSSREIHSQFNIVEEPAHPGFNRNLSRPKQNRIFSPRKIEPDTGAISPNRQSTAEGRVGESLTKSDDWSKLSSSESPGSEGFEEKSPDPADLDSNPSNHGEGKVGR